MKLQTEREVTYAAVPRVTALTCVLCPGEMKHDNKARPVRGTEVTEFRHCCTKCSAYEWFTSKYPRVEFERAPLSLDTAAIAAQLEDSE